jgi:hypothetical protein
MKPSLAKLLVDSAGQFPHRPAVRFMARQLLSRVERLEQSFSECTAAARGCSG